MIIRLLCLFLFFASSSAVAAIDICGGVDFRTTENEMLERLVFNSDLQNGKPNLHRGQCGVPGEQIRVCTACADAISPAMLRSIRAVVGRPEHTEWHAKWHNIRRLAPQLTGAQFAKLVELRRIPDGQTKNEFAQAHGLGGTQSGEDFLYMHRMMIKMVQVQLASESLPCIAPWTTLPATLDDRIWPVPSILENPQLRATEQLRFDRIKSVLKRLEDPAYIATVSLNDFGNRIETTIHQSLHDFYRSSIECTPTSIANKTCDDLVPVDTSPLNKYFWKIHGLVDQLIGRWLQVHRYREISLDCGGRYHCYQWKNPWVEPYPTK